MSNYIACVIAAGLVKISASYFYMEILIKPKFKWLIITWIVVLVLWMAGTTTYLAMENSMDPYVYCPSAPTDFWDWKCAPVEAAAFLDVVTDITTLLIPAPFVRKSSSYSGCLSVILLTQFVGNVSSNVNYSESYRFISLYDWQLVGRALARN
jgi:hypothetical protein